MRPPLVLRAAMTLALFTTTANAHHNFPRHYDGNRWVEIRGVVEAFNYENPHITIVLEKIDDTDAREIDTATGEPIRWKIETFSATVGRRRGLRADTIKPGEIITVKGWPSRKQGAREMGGSQIVQETGQIFVMRRLINKGRIYGGTQYPGEFPDDHDDHDHEPVSEVPEEDAMTFHDWMGEAGMAFSSLRDLVGYGDTMRDECLDEAENLQFALLSAKRMLDEIGVSQVALERLGGDPDSAKRDQCVRLIESVQAALRLEVALIREDRPAVASAMRELGRGKEAAHRIHEGVPIR